MKDFAFEEKKKRILNPLYEGEEWKILYVWIKSNSITVSQMKELILLINSKGAN